MDIFNTFILPCLCSFAACAAFGVQFNIRDKNLLGAAAGAVISQLAFSLTEAAGLTGGMCCFIAAAAVSVYSEILARLRKVPVNMFQVIGIIPLVPGGLTYYACLSLVGGEREAFLDRATLAFAEAGSIAMGIFAVSSVFKIASQLIQETKRT
ncbi:MAG: threonine/serine exporter family protein [Ruminococcus sp.]|nr:threonine/serine exporter family protein [Ruminococcus sp.]